MKRAKREKDYWNICALDPDVDKKYICELDDDQRLKALGKLEGRVLEIGCGIGRLLKQGYYGIDISERMLKIAKNKKPYCNYKLCDGRTIPFEANYFDCVYCVLVFQHIPIEGFVEYVQEVTRVLKPGGKFVFQIIEGKKEGEFSHHYDLESVKEVLEKNNFKISKIKKGLVHKSWTWITVTKNK